MIFNRSVLMSDDDEIILGSRGNWVEEKDRARVVQEVASGDGEYDVTVLEQSDQPPAEEPVVETPATEEAPVAEEVIPPVEETAPPVADPPAVDPQKKLGSIARMKQKHREETARLTKELEDLRKQVGQPKPAEVPPPVAAPQDKTPIIETAPPVVNDPEPDPTNEAAYPEGSYDPKFIRDMGKWAAREVARETAAAERTAKQERETREHQELQAKATNAQEAEAKEIEDRWQATCKEAKETYPDYAEVMQRPATAAPATPAMIFAVRDQENSGMLAYWLCKHPEEAQRIAKLTTVPEGATTRQQRQAYAQAIREIEQIQVKMVNEEPPESLEDEDDAGEEAPAPVAAPPAPKPGVQPPAKAPVPQPAPKAAVTRPPAKQDPPPSVGGGGRGSFTPRPVEELAKAGRGSAAEKQLRELDPDEYRKQRGMDGRV